jgi:hypothetical protein
MFCAVGALQSESTRIAAAAQHSWDCLWFALQKSCRASQNEDLGRFREVGLCSELDAASRWLLLWSGLSDSYPKGGKNGTGLNLHLAQQQ